MADPKDGASFFKKMVKFVANPATEWSEIAGSSRQDDAHDLERSELKAMIERKRRNDFVRKREFDMLRKLRREGLSPEQLAALGGTARDDSEARLSEATSMARPEMGVKAKIDEIEQQMVGDTDRGGRLSRHDSRHDSRHRQPPGVPPDPAPLGRAYDPTEPMGLMEPADAAAQRLRSAAALLGDLPEAGLPPLAAQGEAWTTAAGAAAPAGASADEEPGRSQRLAVAQGALEVNEVQHDPDLDEAVISFANADFVVCEESLLTLCRPGGVRRGHAETWHVLMDFYRAVGQQQAFEALALDYLNQFGRSAPQWISLPKLVALSTEGERPDVRGVRNDVGWVCPPQLQAEDIARLRSATLQLPLPWVLDWQGLQRVEVEAAAQLQQLLRQWSSQPLEMRWMAAEQLTQVLADAAPTGMRDADPAFWMARLEALRLVNRPDQFDEAAIDFCVTYEVSPPSWEKARCNVRSVGAGASTTTPPMSIVTEPNTAFLDSAAQDDPGLATAFVELSGQLTGDISATLKKLDKSLGAAQLVSVSCAKLIRVDFPAAGDLLNWVLAKQQEQRRVSLVDAHRLVALFFGAMGINEYARVQVNRA